MLDRYFVSWFLFFVCSSGLSSLWVSRVSPREIGAVVPMAGKASDLLRCPWVLGTSMAADRVRDFHWKCG